ncbi:pyrophosphate-energized membrane proton pump 2 isoform X1 [Tanacetum coccineum]
MIREPDEEEEDEKSGKQANIFALRVTHSAATKRNPLNAFGSNQKESFSCEFQQSLMPKGITPVAVRTSQESQTWVRKLGYNHVPTDAVTARIINCTDEMHSTHSNSGKYNSTKCPLKLLHCILRTKNMARLGFRLIKLSTFIDLEEPDVKEKNGTGYYCYHPGNNFFLSTLKDLPISTAELPLLDPDTKKKVFLSVVMRMNVRLQFVFLLFAFGSLFYVGASTSPIIDEGPPEMIEISDAIRDGAEGFFNTQYAAISKMALLLALLIFAIYIFRPQQDSSTLGSFTTASITVFSFLLGAVCSGMAGYVGMWVSVRANVRVSSAARRSAREALQIAVRAGGFSALVVVGMAVLGVAILYATFYVCLGVDSPGSIKVTDCDASLLVGYGVGASFVALFAQLGGGIYTKAADVGADLVGKVEQGIPEDDPWNPAVIAYLVGDNVGDCAARGADLFESIAAEIISAMILGGTMAHRCKIEGRHLVSYNFIIINGIFSIRGTRDPGVIGVMEDPMTILQKGYSITILLAVLTFGLMLYTKQAPSAWLNFALCGLVGIMTAYHFVWITQYYTDYKHELLRKLALSSSTGHGTNILAGISLRLESTALPVIVISIAIVSAFWLCQTSGLVDEAGNPTGGLFGTAVATMGMLSTAAYVLTMDMFGPIADNAGGIVEMSQQPESVREITDVLDAAGNTTKATTKGFAIGSAALASFLLFSAYMDEVATFAHTSFTQVDIAIPEVFVGGLLGSMLIFLFSAWACAAVGRTAQEVVNEVRRQFIERPGIMDYKEKPDYGRCVAIVASASLREMIKPGALAVLSPIFIGHPLLGAKVVAAMLMFATVSGILMALFLNTAGGAWDNAKKYIETGALGGKGSDSHKAAITGDTVGDPFKDTAGPSLHVLIKMLATITLVMAPVFL